MSTNTKNDKVISIAKSTVNTRLPCRGCTVDCKNYKHCDGLLWRMNSLAITEEKK